ncbi:MAG TPA: hypothetical protein VLC09_07220 [Polyangiaceae bacterium]|nr:hypothetical protein [Polyangiaceae bacterium]
MDTDVADPDNFKDLDVLRRKTAREVVLEANHRCGGGIAHVRVRRDEDAKALRVTLWWGEEKAREAIERQALALLSRWVWEGWSATIEKSAEPRPDVVWDPYAAKFVPRKAYRPLGTEGRVKWKAG